MLTPVFEVSQNDQFLLINVRAPFAKVDLTIVISEATKGSIFQISDTEIEYSGNEFLFTSKPYFLRLYLPKEVVDNDTGTAEYNSDNGTFPTFYPPDFQCEKCLYRVIALSR